MKFDWKETSDLHDTSLQITANWIRECYWQLGIKQEFWRPQQQNETGT